MVTVNKLEALLNEIGSFNSFALDFKADGERFEDQRAKIVEQARSLGIKQREAEAMLAKIKCSVEMPASETDSSPPAETQKEDGSQAAGDGEQRAANNSSGVTPPIPMGGQHAPIGPAAALTDEWPEMPVNLQRAK